YQRREYVAPWRLPMRLFPLLNVAFFATAVQAPAQDKVVDQMKALFDKADTVTVFALNPDPKIEVKDGFHGWEITGRVEVTTGKKEGLCAVLKSIAAKAEGAKCFDPGHGVRVVAGKTQADLVICFKCNWVRIFIAGAEGPITHTIGEEAHVALDRVLKAK